MPSSVAKDLRGGGILFSSQQGGPRVDPDNLLDTFTTPNRLYPPPTILPASPPFPLPRQLPNTMAENKDEEVSDAELQSGSEEEEELDLSNPDVVTKYKMAAEIANRTFRRTHTHSMC